MAFNFVGRLQLVGPTNLGQIVSQINRQLSGIRANININISPNTATRINALNTQLSGLNTQLSQVALNAQKAQAALTSLATGLNNLNSVTVKLPSSLNSSNSALSTTATVSNDAAQGIKQFGEQAGLATRRFLAFSLAAGSLVGIAGFFKQGIQNAIEFERQLVRLNQVGAGTREELKGIASEISRVSTAYGSSSKDLSEVAVTLRQAGLEAKDVRVALDALAQSTLSPSFGSLNNTVEGLIATFSQFKITAAQSAEVLGSINAVSAGLAVEAEDITSAISKAGGAFALLANASNSPIQNLREFIAVFSSVRATTRESADTIATGLRSVFTRFQRPEVVDSLRELGINLRFTRAEAQALGNTSLENQFVGAYEAVVRLSEGLRSIPNTSSQFAAIVESLGGIRQVSRILPLLSEGGVALRQQALALSQAGASSLSDTTQKGLESLAVRGRQVYEEFQKLFRLITEDSGFQVFAKSLLILAEGLAKVLQFAKPLIPVLLTLASASIFKSLGTFGAGFAQKFVSSQGSSYYNIRGYATGGKVGGTGNKDSELAALTPGEYIVPKQAAQRIGYNNLEEMSKGGNIQRFAVGGPVPKGAIALDPPNNLFYQLNGKIYNRPLAIGIGAGAAFEAPKISLKKGIVPGGALFTTIKDKGYLSKVYGEIVSFYEARKKKVAGKDKNLQQYVNAPNSPYNGIIGSEFELETQKLLTRQQARDIGGNPGDIRSPDRGAFIGTRANKVLNDVVDLSGNRFSQKVKSQFGSLPSSVIALLQSLPDNEKKIYIDFSDVRVGDIKKYLGEQEEAKVIRQSYEALNPKGTAFENVSLLTRRFLTAEPKKNANGGIIRMAGGGIVPGVGNSDSFPAVLNEGDYVIKKSSAQRAGYPALQALANNRFAEGGVVPALLMPGEFVFDQKQASKIGKANLDNLNRTGETKGIRKYASGGYITKFATGAYGKKTTPLEEYLGQSNPGFKLNNRNVAQTGSALTGLEAKLVTVLKSQIDAGLKNASQGEKAAVLAAEISNFYELIKRQKAIELEINKTQANILKREQRNVRLEAKATDTTKTQSYRDRAQKLLEENRERLLEAQISLPTLYAQEADLKNKTSLVTDSKGNLQGFSGQNFIPPKPPTLRERFADPNTRILAAQLALPFIGQAVDSFAGEATATSGGKFIAAKSVGGALTGAATGAALGSTFGLPGAVIGGIGGALVGFVTSFTGASKEIQEAKVGEALKNLTTSFETLNRELKNTGGISEGSLREFRSRSSILASETLARETSDATGGIGALLGTGSFGSTSTSRVFGGRGGIFNILPSLLGLSRLDSSPTSLSEAYTRATSTPATDRSADVSAFIRRYESAAIERLPRVLEPARFLARTAIDSGRGRGVSAVREGLGEEDFSALVTALGGLRGFGEFIRSVERESVRASDTPVFNQFSRLTSTLDALNTSFLTLANTSQNLDSILSGSGQQARNVPINLNNFNDPNFARNAETVRSGLGLGGIVGAEFTRFATSATLLTETLESSLRDAGTGGVERASEILGGRLRRSGTPEELINRLTRRTSAIELTPGADLGRVASETVAAIFPPELQRLAEIYNTRQSAVIESLNRYNNVLKQSTELSLRLNELNQQQENVRAGFEAQNRGLGSGAGVLFSRTSSDDRFRADLRTLLSRVPGTGLNENSSASAFGSEIQRLQNALPTAEEGPARAGLLNATSIYTQALQRMADVTTRTTSIQENLNRLEQSREARLNFNQRYFTADPESRARTNRGILLAQNLEQSGGDIGDLPLENRRLIFDALNQLGSTRVAAFGGRTGTEQGRLITNNSRFGITAPTGENEQINTLQQQILTVYGQANEATIALRNVIQNDLRLSNNSLITTQEQLRVATERLATAMEREIVGGPILSSLRTAFPSIAEAVGFNSGGPVPYYASQGLMNRGRDTVPAMLTPGEYVVNADAASRNRGLLDAVNGNYLAGGGIPVGFGGMFRIIPEERTGIFGGAFRRPFEGGIATGLRGIDTAPAPIVRELSPLARRVPGFIERPDLTIGGIDDTIYGPRGPDPLRPILIDAPRPDPRRAASRISGDYLNQQSLLEEASIGRGLRNNLYERQVASRFSENFGQGIQLSTLEQENRDLLNRRDNSGFIGATRDFSSGRRSITSSNFVSGSFFNIPGSDVNTLRRIAGVRNTAGNEYADFLMNQGNLGEPVRSTTRPTVVGGSPLTQAIFAYSRETGIPLGRTNEMIRGHATARGLSFEQAFRELAEGRGIPLATFGLARGGPVYANNGLFVPRGTDTIPAMLSPGEYVINRRSTEQFRPLLEQINNNRFANGGPVGKVDQGFGPGVDTSGFSEASRNISRSFVDFGNSVRQLTQAIESIPTNIQLTANHRVEIIHNGVEIFSKMEPMIRDLVVGETSKQLNQFVKDKLPDLQ